jgi:hypothetical protein
LISNELDEVVYQGDYYTLAFRDDNELRYMGYTEDPNTLNIIVVNRVTGEYVYSQIVNGLLIDHINDNERHINEGERDFWNRKLNYETEGEILTFNRN